MNRKGLDLIVANGPESLDADFTRATILTREGEMVPYRGPKVGLAGKILDALETFIDRTR